MRGSPPCEIAVAPSGAWRLGIVLVAGAGLASMAVWLVTSPLGEGTWPRLAVAGAALAVVAIAMSLWRSDPRTLCWDGDRWSLDSGAASLAPVVGELLVALDLGSFLLLRFRPDGRSGPVAVRWIPVGRRGLEREWHAFRCAVYSPRPASGPSVADPPLS